MIHYVRCNRRGKRWLAFRSRSTNSKREREREKARITEEGRYFCCGILEDIQWYIFLPFFEKLSIDDPEERSVFRFLWSRRIYIYIYSRYCQELKGESIRSSSIDRLRDYRHARRRSLESSVERGGSVEVSVERLLSTWEKFSPIVTSACEFTSNAVGHARATLEVRWAGFSRL